MLSQIKSLKRTNNRTVRLPKWLPFAGFVAVCAFPVVLSILFYTLRSNSGAMDWAATRVSAPIRGALGFISSIFPFSLMETLIVFAGVFLIRYIVITVKTTRRCFEKLKYLSKRLLMIAVVFLYIWSLFCWLWNSGYHAPGFGAKNGFTRSGVTVEDLTAVTAFFAMKANELAPLVSRDDDGHYAEDEREIFALSPFVYDRVSVEFPSLGGRLYKPKPMMFSWLMSRTGYTGVYFALTGESNFNANAPLFLIPATIAHELAHQLGVAREDEANFVGILACVTSGYTTYEYAGYLSGLIHLRSALFLTDDYEAWVKISDYLCDEVYIDLQDNSDFWWSQKTVETGVTFLDNVLTSMTETLSDTVDAVYDGYLRAQSQELGIRSYGACVDLLVEYFR